MPFPKSRKGRIAAVVGLITVLLVGTVGPSAIELIPKWGSGNSLDPSELAPDQAWGSAEGQPHESEGTTAANRAMPKSELAKYPQPNFPAAPAPPPNKAQQVDSPNGFKGFNAQTSKEDTGRRSANSRTFTNTDGTETTEYSQSPMNFQRPDGSWAPIDTTIVKDGNGFRNAADSVDTRFDATASESPFVRMRLSGDHEMSFGFAGTAASKARVEGSRITYPGVAAHTDLQLDVTSGGAKETLVLSSGEAATSWLFPWQLKGMQAKIADGDVVLTDGSGKVVARIPAGHMVDAQGAVSNAITYELVSHNGGQALKMTADPSWVRDGARKFPIAVDPTVSGPDASAAVSTNGTSSIRGSELKSGDGYTTYLKYDLGGIANHRVFNAMLYLTNFDAPSCRADPITVHAVNQGWDENTKAVLATGGALADARFGYGYVGLGQSHSACPPRPEGIDLGDAGKDLVQGWVKGQANNGFAVKASGGWKKFAGRGTANPPKLFVTSTPYDAGYRIERGVPEPPVHRTSDNPPDPNAAKPVVRIAVTNKSGQTWTPGAYKLSYRAFNSAGQPKDARVAAELPRNVAPNETVTLDARVFQLEPGDYVLDFSMVHNNTFFTDEQIPPARLSLTVFELPPIVKAQYPPAGHSSPVLTPQLWADAVDVDAPPNTTIDYEFEVCQKNDQTGEINVGCRLSPRSKSRTWTVPKGWLQWSETYYWRAFAIDPSGTRSEKLEFSALMTAVPQPDVTSHLGGAPYSSGDLDFDPQIGNYTTGAVDSAIGVAGPELTIARTYNSLDPRKDLAFGAGWSTRYDMRVVPDNDGSGNVVVTYPDGQAVRFGRNAEDGSFDPPPGRFATFYQDVASPSQNYVLVDKSNTVYTFRPSDGRIITIYDNAGRLLEFDYAVNGQLKRAINRTSNRTLYFTWSGAHVKEVRTDAPVTGGTPIKWTYEYFGDQLKKVCDPTSACTQYEYSTGSHYRSAVMDSKPDSYWRLGEPSGEPAVSQVATNLTKDWGAHLNTQLGVAGPLDGSPDTAAGFNGTNSMVKLPDGAIKKSRDLSIEMWFKTTAGGPLMGFQHKPFDQNPEGAVPVLYVDKDGKLRGQFWHGRVSPITSAAAVNNDQWHHVVLTGSLAVTTMYLDGTKVGEITGAEIDDSRLNFGQIGAAHAVGPADWAPYGWWPNEGKKFFTGQIDEVALYQHPLGESAVKTHYAARGHSDQLAKVTMPSGRVAAQIGYDTVNDRISDYTDENAGTWKLGVPQVSGNEEKDAAGRSVKNLVRSVEVTDPGKRSHFFDYDPIKGRIIRFVAPLGVGVRHEDRADPSVVPTTPTAAAPCTGNPTPNPDGSPTYCGGKTGNNPNWIGGPVQGVGVRSYDYDESGFQHVITDENGHQVELKHDERGNVLSRKMCRTSTQCDTEYFTYQPPAPGHVNDTDPRIDKQLTSRDARSASASDDTYLTSSAYNERGDLSKQTLPDGSTVEHAYTAQGEAGEGGGVPAGLLKSTKDGRGKITSYRYFANGDLFSVTEPPRAEGAAGTVTEYRYDLLGRKISEKQISDAHPAGLETKYLYDARNKPLEVTDAAVTNAVTGVKHTRHTRTTFNADGQPERVDIADLTGGDETRTIAYGYDDRGRQSSVTDAEGATTSYSYDVFGNRTSVVDPLGTKVEYAYTARNKLAEVRLRGFHGKAVSGGIGTGETADNGRMLVLEAYTYDLGGRLIWQTDAMGRKTMYDYFQNGLLFRSRAEVRNADGSKSTKLLEENTYDAAGNVLSRKGAGDRVTSYKYNRNNQVEEIVADPGTGKLARTTLYAYDQNGLVKQIVKSGQASNTGTMSAATSEVVDYTYDNVGNQLTESIKFGTSAFTTSRQYDRRGLMVAETDARGFTTEYSYDEQERQVRVKQPSVAVETNGGAPVSTRPENVVGFNTFGDEVESRDENGQITKRFYDKTGRPLRVELPDYVAPGTTTPIKAATSTRYDASGNAVEVTSPRGAVTRYRYDQLGRMVERQDPKADAPTEVGGVWKYTYTHKGEQLSVTDPTGARTESTYDDLGRQVTSSVLERKPVAAAFTSTFEYNDSGELIKATAPNNDVTKFTYDALGQRLTSTDPANVTTKFGYDGSGRQVWQQDAMGRTSFVRYDAAGRMNGQFSLDGQGQILRRTTYTHDAAGNVETATDAMSHTARFTYDALGRMTQQVEPVSDTESITTSFGYDAAGQRTRYTDGRGNKFVTTYNPWSLPESVVEPSTDAHPNAADRTWTTSYDAAGNVAKMVAPGAVTRERQYDSLNRVVRETGAGTGVASAERTQAYDETGRLLESGAPSGKNTFTYNDRSGMLTATGLSGDSSFEYDELGRLKTRTDASGTARFTYDKGRLHTATDSITGTGQVFGYNAAGQLSKIQYGTSRNRDLDYDALGRMKSDVMKDATTSAVVSSLAYEYDDNDRLARKVTTGLAGSADNTYTYDYANRLKSWTAGGVTTPYEWDASGNRTRAGDKTAAYDQRNRLLSDSDYTYRYSPAGAMLSRTSSGFEEKFSFDAFDRMIAVGKTSYAYDGFDRVVSRNTKKFAYAGTDIDPVSDTDSLYGRGVSGELLSISQGGEKRVAVTDKHGDLVGGFDPAQPGMQDSAAYDPFGKQIASAGSKRSVGYQGDWTDPDSGQVNMGARWYQPSSGAFASRDTVSASSGASVLFNRYTYGAGRPLDMIDPDGHWPNWGAVWNGVKSVAKVGFEVVKEVSGYNDVANFIREPSLGNFLWAASNFVPFGKLAKGAKYLFKYGDDLLGGARKYGDDLIGAGRKYGDDAAGAARKYGDDVAGAGRRYGDDVAGLARRNAADMAKTAAKEAAQAAARKAAAAARAAAERLARMKAVTARAKAAISHAVKNNPMPILQAALKPRVALKDLVSSSANMPARMVAAVAENVQDVNKVWDTIKATIIKPGVSVIQSVGEQMVSDFANSQVPGLGDLIGLFGPNRKRGNDKAKDSGAHGRNEAGAACPVRRSKNSFTGDTPVLMADGSRKLIRDLRNGDMVLATNPLTGQTEGRKITDVRRYLTDATVHQLEITSDSGTGKISVTDEHPFWVPDLGRWVGAEDIKPGYRFLTADNRSATVTGTRTFSGGRLVYNLTVDGLHTYYVGAGGPGKAAAADVLVHNDDPNACGTGNGTRSPGDDGQDPFEVATQLAVDHGGLPSATRGQSLEAIRLTNGLVYKGAARKSTDPMHVDSETQGVLDAVKKRGNGHGQCGLIACISDAQFDGHDVRGAEAAAIMGRSPNNDKYLWGMDPCDSCKDVVSHYGIQFRTRDRRSQ